MDFKTPVKNKNYRAVQIPPSPYMKQIGFGTGIAVYQMERAPVFSNSSSPWAVKKLIQKHKNNIELDQRLKEEAEVLRNLNHPNIVGFRAFIKDTDGRNILAMEECASCLGDMIEERDIAYSAKTILRVSYDISMALDYLHNKVFLMHCDIKSYNILVNGDFIICKLCDFGVCLPVTKIGEVDRKRAGKEAEYIGTAAWSAPEILQCPQDITTKADIYAFGLVIWEMIALAPPVDEDFVNSFNSSQINMNSSTVSCNDKPLRIRPALPDFDLDEEYNLLLEIFYCCTEVDKNKRPAAKDINIMLEEIHKDQCDVLTRKV